MIKRNNDTTTKAIRNAGKVLNMKMIAINKISGKLKNNRFKIPPLLIHITVGGHLTKPQRVRIRIKCFLILNIKYC